MVAVVAVVAIARDRRQGQRDALVATLGVVVVSVGTGRGGRGVLVARLAMGVVAALHHRRRVSRVVCLELRVGCNRVSGRACATIAGRHGRRVGRSVKRLTRGMSLA